MGEPMALSLKPCLVEQRLELANLQIGQGEDVGAEDRAKLDVADAAGFEDVDLLLRIGIDFVGEGTEGEHGISSYGKASPGCHGQLVCPCLGARSLTGFRHGQASCPWHPNRHCFTMVIFALAAMKAVRRRQSEP